MNQISAAHCIQGKGSSEKLSNGDIEVRLGAYNLTAKSEENVVLRDVSVILVHPDWNVYNDDYDADLAILVLNDYVTFTEYIQRIYLPADGVVVDGSNINLSGTIVGWGLAERTTHEEVPKQADIGAYNFTYCFLTLKVKGIVELSSTRTFCAGSEEGNPSRGDSGGGFFVNADDTWRQYGIISAIIANETGHVSRTLASVYTNVQSFQSWIEEMMMMKIPTIKGQWPFIVVVHNRKESRFLGVGTLISNRHILTGNNDKIIVVQLSALTRIKF